MDMSEREQFLKDSAFLGIDPAKISRSPCSGEEAHQLRWENQVMTGKLRMFEVGRIAEKDYTKDLKEKMRKFMRDLEGKQIEIQELKKKVEELELPANTGGNGLKEPLTNPGTVNTEKKIADVPGAPPVNTVVLPPVMVTEKAAVLSEAPEKKKATRRTDVPIPGHVTVIPGNTIKYKCNGCKQPAFNLKASIRHHKDCVKDLTPKMTPGSRKKDPLDSTKEGNYLKCGECAKVYPSRCQWKQCPYRERVGSFQCSLCGKFFSGKYHLIRHMQNVHKMAAADVKKLLKNQKKKNPANN